jgi:hypothetical protein
MAQWRCALSPRSLRPKPSDFETFRWENGPVATHEPYGSAAHIPSIADMLRKIEGGKFLTRFIARDQRAKLVELEQQVRGHVAAIDRVLRRPRATQLDRPR